MRPRGAAMPQAVSFADRRRRSRVTSSAPARKPARRLEAIVMFRRVSSKSSVLSFALLMGFAAIGCNGASPSPGPLHPDPVHVQPGGDADARQLAAERRELAARRAVQIERLRAYREAGVFPRNLTRPALANIFVDERGVRCAVANLATLDGLDQEVLAMSR